VNFFNRLVMLILALLLIAVPVLLLLVGLGILPASQISPYYRPVLGSLGNLASVFSYDAGARTVVGLIGLLVFIRGPVLATQRDSTWTTDLKKGSHRR